MAAATEASKIQLNLGNRMAVLATFSSAGATDYWDTGLGKVEACFIENGTSGVTTGATYSGGRVTFACSGGLTNALVLAIGHA
jgi:hypothetical protein